MAHFPGHNYLGPGSDLHSGAKPVDSDDEIAYEHDLAYSRAKEPEDIRRADRVAINKFWDHGGLHGYAGAAGLGVKYGVESLTGVLYPRLNGEMPPPTKRAHEEMPATGSGEGNEQSPQAGSSLPGGTGSDVMATIITMPRAGSSGHTYSKCFQLYTAGFQFSTIGNFGNGLDTLFQVGSSTVWNYLATPIGVLDPNMLCLFMSVPEYASLPPNSYAKSCRIKVTPLGYRLPFATNEASSSFANSQTLVQILSGVGINTQLNGVISGVQTDPVDLTTIVGLSDVDYMETLYGDNTNSIGASVGIPRHWNRYWIGCNPSIGAIPGQNNIPMMSKLFKIQNVNDCKGTPVVNYSYDFTNGILKSPLSMRAAVTGIIPEGNKQTGFWVHSNNATNPALGSTSIAGYDNVELQGRFLHDNMYDLSIEKNWWWTRNVGHQHTADCPPLVMFGTMPVQSNAALAPVATFANVVVQWQVECELDVGYNLDWPYTNQDYFAWIQSYDPSVGFSNETSAAKWSGPLAYVQNRRIGNSPFLPNDAQYAGNRLTFSNPSLATAEKRTAETQIPRPAVGKKR